MNITVTVTHSIHPDSVSILEKIFSTFTAAPATAATPSMNGNGKVKEEKPSANGTDTVDAIVKITIEQVRAAVQKQSQAGKRDKIKSLLADFGADKVTSLQPAQYSDFFQKIEAL